LQGISYLLYVRHDLLGRYASGRHLVQLSWGERELRVGEEGLPSWMRAVWDDGAHRWRRIGEIRFD
jgi:hypothetical protein